MPSRRDFLKQGAAFTGIACLPDHLRPLARFTAIDTAPRAGDPTLRDITAAALDAARSAGATYADVRLTLVRTQRFLNSWPLVDEEVVGLGVRALVNGYWGFVSSPVWSMGEAARLGREAAAQGRVNNWGIAPAVALGDPPPPATGVWITPIKRDPFTVSYEEKIDFCRTVQACAEGFRNGAADSGIAFRREERTFASTDGAFCTQTLHTALTDQSYITVSVADPVTGRSGRRTANAITPTAGGYEVLTDAGIIDAIPSLYEAAARQLESVPLAIGRYDVIFDGMAMAAILSRTIVPATEIDRVRGFEANAGGTSYLGPVATMLGTTVASPTLTLTASRTTPGGAASVQWDDDGVVPDDFTLVDAGTLTDYATSREHVTVLGDWYDAHSIPRHSHGCAGSASASNVPVVQPPNVTMASGADNKSFDDLVRQVGNGLAIIGGDCTTDQRRLNGQGTGEVVYRINDGVLGPAILGAAYQFRAPEFWALLSDVGGDPSRVSRGFETMKGQPMQLLRYSVSAPAAMVRNVNIVDPTWQG